MFPNSQALFNACESTGPGILVHPTRGAVMAACRSAKVKDEIEDKAGETTADLEFVEANDPTTGIGGLLFGIIATGLNVASRIRSCATTTPSWWRSPGALT